jgi:hypothetical protein
MFMDWDETISAHDTLALIAPPDGQQQEGERFAWYGEAYMHDLQEHLRSWKEGGCDATTMLLQEDVRDDLGHAWTGYWNYLISLDAVELASQRRIEEGGLFVGFDPRAMTERARQVKLRPGWSDFAKKRLSGNQDDDDDEWHVISVGWSAKFIEAALGFDAGAMAPPRSICANEVELDDETKRGTGRLTKSRDSNDSRGIRTAPHKLREMRRITMGRRKRDGQTKPFTVYFGDSPTDLGCMVEADVGVVMGGKQSMTQAITEAGLNTYLCDGNLDQRSECVAKAAACSTNAKVPCLITAQDWFEVEQFIDAMYR